jgi:hypothetical protein
MVGDIVVKSVACVYRTVTPWCNEVLATNPGATIAAVKVCNEHGRPRQEVCNRSMHPRAPHHMFDGADQYWLLASLNSE